MPFLPPSHRAKAEYHPTLGRWLQRDPVEYADGMSLYEYVGSRPTSGLDAKGMHRIEITPVQVHDPGRGLAGAVRAPQNLRVELEDEIPKTVASQGTASERVSTVCCKLRPKANVPYALRPNLKSNKEVLEQVMMSLGAALEVRQTAESVAVHEWAHVGVQAKALLEVWQEGCERTVHQLEAQPGLPGKCADLVQQATRCFAKAWNSAIAKVHGRDSERWTKNYIEPHERAAGTAEGEYLSILNMHASDSISKYANPYLSEAEYWDIVQRESARISAQMPPTPTFEPFSVGKDP